MRKAIAVLWMLACSAAPAAAQVSVGIGLPNVSIGINLPVYPQLVAVPGYPVYYAPQVNSNYFFYDGMYWVYQDDNWYASSWYNGPWGPVARDVVPVYVLRVPVRYYRAQPAYFRGWQADAPPRWGDHWGNEWAQRRSGWDQWNRGSAPAPAPLPVYQRQYSGDRYPQATQQRALQSQNYRYQPKDPVVRQQYQAQQAQAAPAPAPRAKPVAAQERASSPQGAQRSNAPPVQQGVKYAQPPQKGGENAQRPAQSQPPRENPQMQQQSPPPQHGAAQRAQAAPKTQGQQPQQGASQHAPAPKAHAEGKGGGGKDSRQGQGEDKESQKPDDRGQDRRK
jgi:hypothetical protein